MRRICWHFAVRVAVLGQQFLFHCLGHAINVFYAADLMVNTNDCLWPIGLEPEWEDAMDVTLDRHGDQAVTLMKCVSQMRPIAHLRFREMAAGS